MQGCRGRHQSVRGSGQPFFFFFWLMRWVSNSHLKEWPPSRGEETSVSHGFLVRWAIVTDMLAVLSDQRNEKQLNSQSKNTEITFLKCGTWCSFLYNISQVIEFELNLTAGLASLEQTMRCVGGSLHAAFSNLVIFCFSRLKKNANK